MKTIFRRLSIRYRLLLSYSLTYILISVLGTFAVYSVVRTTLEQNIEKELKNSTQAILGMLKTAIDSSIRNHLRAISENNKDIVMYFYQQYKKGLLTQKEAKTAAARVLLSQVIGTSGYLYCINSQGIVIVHPEAALIGTDLSDNGFIRTQKQKKQGYIEYYWANPSDSFERPKALYMNYFAPWDWIISASSYRDEFNKLLKVDDFQNYILSITFGKTGYSYVMDSKGLLIIHPTLQGTNIYQSKDDNNRMFIKEICKQKNGKIIYPWKNPGEKKAREKLVIFNYIPELDWIVASSSYLEELYHPLTTIGYFAALTLLLLLVLIVPITWWISSRLAKPLQEMVTVFENGANADFSKRLTPGWGGEIEDVTRNYNRFIDTLETTREQLKKSEAKFRSIFENSLEGIFQATLKGDLITANPAMADMFGFDSSRRMISETDDFWNRFCHNPAQRKELLEILQENKVLYEYQIQFIRKDNRLIWCVCSAKAYRTEPDGDVYIEGFLSDITQRKSAQTALEQSHNDLEQKIEHRTRELAEWVKELEQKDLESAWLRKMSKMVQICHTKKEIFDVARQYLVRFFPETSGCLYMWDDDQAALSPILFWGDPPGNDMALVSEDCWALRQGKPYLMQKTGNDLPCRHLSKSDVDASLCVPMMVKENLLGMLVIEAESENTLLSGQDLAFIITEHLSLALINTELRESLRRQSIQDPLTGLYNRRFLDESLKREAYSMKRHAYSIGFIMMDIDHFKLFNDTHGHECGDAILSALGAFLQKNIRGNDIACRYGGEEFIIVLIKTDFKETLKKAEQLHKLIQDTLTIVYGTTRHAITVSAGVAVCPDHGSQIYDAVKAADTALYQAKKRGRNQVARPE